MPIRCGSSDLRSGLKGRRVPHTRRPFQLSAVSGLSGRSSRSNVTRPRTRAVPGGRAMFQKTGGCHTPTGRFNSVQLVVSQVTNHTLVYRGSDAGPVLIREAASATGCSSNVHESKSLAGNPFENGRCPYNRSNRFVWGNPSNRYRRKEMHDPCHRPKRNNRYRWNSSCNLLHVWVLRWFLCAEYVQVVPIVRKKTSKPISAALTIVSKIPNIAFTTAVPIRGVVGIIPKKGGSRFDDRVHREL